ncbi:hypothetical protein V8E36_008482 [Tilletia maclaganii]
MEVDAVHLVVCVHGLFGTPEDLQYFANALVRSAASPRRSTSFVFYDADNFSIHDKDDVALELGLEQGSGGDEDQGPSIVVLNSHANIDLTFDGVDFCGYRLAEEINTCVHKLRLEPSKSGGPRHIAQISFVGHSLGGLIARFAVGLLEQQGFFDTVQRDRIPKLHSGHLDALAVPPRAAIFATFATPHIGMPPESRSGRPWLARLTAATMGRTGIQLYLHDHGWACAASPADTRIGVLEAMTEPSSVFMVALNRFDRVVTYANGIYDFPVAFRTASLFTSDPFAARGLAMELDPQYTGIVTSYSLPQGTPSLMERIKRKLTPPALFNPRRIPASFPLNYILVLIMPFVLLFLPLILGLVIVFFKAYAKKSTLRVQALIHQNREEDELASTAGSSAVTMVVTNVEAPKSADSTSAVAKLDQETLDADEAWYARRRAAIVRPVAGFSSSSSLEANSKATDVLRSTELVVKTAVFEQINAADHDPEALESLASHLLSTHPSSVPYPLPTTRPATQHRLHPPQLRMIARWHASLGARFGRHFVKYEDVLDTHPLIIVRREGNKADIRGAGIVRHFLDTYISAHPRSVS